MAKISAILVPDANKLSPILFAVALLAASSANSSIDGSGSPQSIDGSGTPMSIDGSGVPKSIDGSGAPMSIDGSGVPQSIDGSGAPMSIDGSGVPQSIDGSGAPMSIDGSGTPQSIDGSGVSHSSGGSGSLLPIDGSGISLSIDGSGTPSSIVGLSAPMSIDGSGIPLTNDVSNVRILAIGPIVEQSNTRYDLMGYTVSNPRDTSGKKRVNIRAGDYMVLTEAIDTSGASETQTRAYLYKIDQEFVHGVSTVLLTGQVKKIARSIGEIEINSVPVDLNNLLRNESAKIKIGGFVAIKGTYPQVGQKILAESLNIL